MPFLFEYEESVPQRTDDPFDAGEPSSHEEAVYGAADRIWKAMAEAGNKRWLYYRACGKAYLYVQLTDGVGRPNVATIVDLSPGFRSDEAELDRLKSALFVCTVLHSGENAWSPPLIAGLRQLHKLRYGSRNLVKAPFFRCTAMLRFFSTLALWAFAIGVCFILWRQTEGIRADLKADDEHLKTIAGNLQKYQPPAPLVPPAPPESPNLQPLVMAVGGVIAKIESVTNAVTQTKTAIEALSDRIGPEGDAASGKTVVGTLAEIEGHLDGRESITARIDVLDAQAKALANQLEVIRTRTDGLADSKEIEAVKAELDRIKQAIPVIEDALKEIRSELERPEEEPGEDRSRETSPDAPGERSQPPSPGTAQGRPESPAENGAGESSNAEPTPPSAGPSSEQGEPAAPGAVDADGSRDG